MAANEKANMKLAKDMYRWFNLDEFDKLAENVAPNVEMKDWAFGVTDQGRDTFVNTLHSMKRAYSDMQVDVKHQMATGDTVVTEFICTGVNDGPLPLPTGEVPPTGKRVKIPICEDLGVQGRQAGSRAQLSGHRQGDAAARADAGADAAPHGLRHVMILLLIDLQNDYFPGGKAALVKSEAACRRAQDLLNAFRERRLPVVHVQQR